MRKVRKPNQPRSEVIANQEKILANQELIKQSQAKLDLLMASQETILANQEAIKSQHLKLDLLLSAHDRLVDDYEPLGEMIGSSPGFQQALKDALSVAETRATVLIRGETGTGKELLAHAIHAHSPRHERPFVTVNCAALPAGLVESELFGYEKGAFTSALGRKAGRFELADGGTIFLDEIGEVPLETQGKFLRVLQRGEFERLGATESVRVNVRIIAATNQPLEQLVAEKKFRSDLFFRLNVFPITLPPLRERQTDIPLLVNYFVEKYRARFRKPVTSISEESLRQLQAYHWPGNIRELEHLIERAVLTAEGEVLHVRLPEVSIDSAVPIDSLLRPEKPPGAAVNSNGFRPVTLAEHERAYLAQVLDYTRGRIAGSGGAAEILGLPPSTLRSRMKKLGLKSPPER
jgi:formate hydrogenlyase transcriptional activator